MRIELIGKEFNLSPVTRNVYMTRYQLDFGIVKQGERANFEIVASDKKPLLDFKASPSCGGCTTVKQKKLSENQYKVMVEYDSKILGKINKSVNINYTTEDGVKSVQIKMTGTIIR